MDPLISKLNERISEKVKGNNQIPNDNSFNQKFEQVLNEKRASQMESLGNLVSSEHDKGLQVMSADNIKININNVEGGAQTTFDPKEKFFGMFEDLNNDMVSLDSTIEVLSNPDVKLNKRQLLAYQAGIGNMTINSELFSKLAQSVSQNLNTLLQTQI